MTDAEALQILQGSAALLVSLCAFTLVGWLLARIK